ncbi:MAG: type I-E CRISPR-associated endoribonuclease Cas2 [Lentisphaeria bacterium]|nr:type I-E CRISPR-associated endoribonuclease Cas2 [Lentisphaeria bacterium]
MTVLVANDTPPAIRGLLKRWFIEPKPNVFVGTVNRRTRERTLDYIRRNAPDMGLLMIATSRTSQGFEIRAWGDTNRRIAEFEGLQLIAEDWDGREEDATAAVDADTRVYAVDPDLPPF